MRRKSDLELQFLFVFLIGRDSDHIDPFMMIFGSIATLSLVAVPSLTPTRKKGGRKERKKEGKRRNQDEKKRGQERQRQDRD
jgi:hypothetical protein